MSFELSSPLPVAAAAVEQVIAEEQAQGHDPAYLFSDQQILSTVYRAIEHTGLPTGTRLEWEIASSRSCYALWMKQKELGLN